MTSELFSLGIMVFMVPRLGVDIEAQKSLRNSGFCLAWQRTGSTIITVQFPAPSDMLGGRRKGLRAKCPLDCFPKKKRPNPALADLAVLAGPWLLLRSRKSVPVRRTRPGCRSASSQAFCWATEGVSTWRWRERWPGGCSKAPNCRLWSPRLQAQSRSASSARSFPHVSNCVFHQVQTGPRGPLAGPCCSGLQWLFEAQTPFSHFAGR